MKKPKLYAIYHRHDDPSKNTIMKAARHGLVRIIHHPPPGAITLTPYTVNVIAPTDRVIIEKRGVCVIDCSWRRRTPIQKASRTPTARRLPILYAGNPINYAKPYTLSSIEALAATLYITGYTETAEQLLSLYKWGHTFKQLNQHLLQAYQEAKTRQEILQIECNEIKRVTGTQIQCTPEKLATIATKTIEHETGKPT